MPQGNGQPIRAIPLGDITEHTKPPPEYVEVESATATVVGHAIRQWEEEKKNAENMDGRENRIASVIAIFIAIGLYQLQWYREQDAAISGVCKVVIKGLLYVGLLGFTATLLGLFSIKLANSGLLTGIPLYLRFRLARCYLKLWRRALTKQERSCLIAELRSEAIFARWSRSLTGRYFRWKLRPTAVGMERASHHLELPDPLYKNSDAFDEVVATSAVIGAYRKAYLSIRQWNSSRLRQLKTYQWFFLFAVAANLLAVALYIWKI